MGRGRRFTRIESKKRKKKAVRYAKDNLAHWTEKYFPRRYDEEPRIRFYHQWSRGNEFKFHKKYSNRKVRNFNGELPNGNYYKKLHDMWWIID